MDYTKSVENIDFKNAALAAAVLIGLYLTTHVNYLLFHSLAELFSIVVAACLFMVTWNSRRYIRNPYLLFVGVAYLFIGFIDLLHTLSYKGMSIFTDYDFYANQLWIGARLIESLSLAAGFLFLGKKTRLEPFKLLLAYAVVTALLVLSVFYWKNFPECYVEGVGLTPFKKNSEYFICGVLLFNLYLLKKNKKSFEGRVYSMIFLSFWCTIVSELAFTFYVSNYGFSNLVGHYFKLFSFYFVYKAIIETCLEDPHKLIFRELDTANKNLNEEIERRKKMEAERESLIEELSMALARVKQLSGLLPICSFCKQIRDDQGYWNEIDEYLREHSDAELTHGVCPKCAKIHYAEFYKSDEDDR